MPPSDARRSEASPPNSASSTVQGHCIAARWLDLLLATTVLSIVLIWLAWPVLDGAACWLGGRLRPIFELQQPVFHWLSITAVVVAFGVTIGMMWATLMTWAGFRRPWPPFRVFYPPSWIATVPTGLTIWLLFREPGGLVWWVDLLIVVAVLLIALLMAALMQWVHAGLSDVRDPPSIHPSNRQGSPLDNLLADRQDFVKWIRSNDPLDSEHHDYLNARHLAIQVAEAIRDRTVRAVTIKGDWGAGKSSVVRMTRGDLAQNTHHNRGFLTCSVPTWGYEETAAEKAVLEAAIQALSDDVDGLGLVHLPQQYLNDLRTGVPWWLRLPLFMQGASMPDRRLARLDRTLQARTSRLAIFIEDVDRNLLRQDGTERRFAEFEALLDRIRQHCDAITVVMVISESRFDFERVSDYLRHIPRLRSEHIISIIEYFRKCCHEAATEAGVIVPAWWERWSDALEHVIDAKSSAVADMESEEKSEHSKPTPHRTSPVELVRPLLHTPRRLKMVLRRTWEAWQRLRGEVLLDELLLVELVRHVSPQTIDFMHGHATADIRALIGDKEETLKRIWKERKERWNEHVTDVNERDRSPLWELVARLFPTHFSLFEGGTPSLLAREQRLYWQRMFDGEMEPEADDSPPRDQTIIGFVHAWKSGTSTEIVRFLLDENYAVPFERLYASGFVNADAARLTAPEMGRLTKQLVSKLLHRDGAEAHGEHEGLLALWRYVIHASGRWDNYVRWIGRQVLRSLKVSVRLALDLEYFWGNADPKSRLLDNHQKRRLRRAMKRWVRRRMDATTLARALSVSSHKHAFALNHLVVRAYHTEWKADTLKDWGWIIPWVQEGLSLRPTTMVVQACALIGSGTRSNENPKGSYWLEKSTACELLPEAEDRKHFLDALLEVSRNADLAGLPDGVPRIVEGVTRGIREWRQEDYSCEPSGGENQDQEIEASGREDTGGTEN